MQVLEFCLELLLFTARVVLCVQLQWCLEDPDLRKLN